MTMKKSVFRRLTAIMLALCMCVGGIAANVTPSYAATSAADTGGTHYVSRPGYLYSGMVSATGTMTLKWKAVSGASGYQLQMSKYSNFSSVMRSYTVGSSVTSKTVTLSSSGVYYFRVRAYVTINGTKYYSDWTRHSGYFKV